MSKQYPSDRFETIEKLPLGDQFRLLQEAADGNIKVLPGKQWAFHYPQDGAHRFDQLQDVLDGTLSAQEVDAACFRPDAVFVPTEALEKYGFAAVRGRVKELTTRAHRTDYQGQLDFCDAMKGRDIDVDLAQRLFEGPSGSRLRKRVYRASSRADRKDLHQVYTQEAKESIQQLPGMTRLDRVMESLKLNWLRDDLKVIDRKTRNAVVDALPTDERQLFDVLKKPYFEYVRNGRPKDFQKMVDAIRDQLPQIQKKRRQDVQDWQEQHQDGEQMTEDGESSQSGQDLMDELQEMMDQMGEKGGPSLPGQPHDSAIPPDDEDEYITPPPSPEGSQMESGQQQPPLFEIDPGLKGDFCSGRKSYFDQSTITWSKKKKLRPYVGGVSNARYTMNGHIQGGLKSLPLPNGYAFDAMSLIVEGGSAQLSRDQNGCFYIQSDAGKAVKFSIDFGKEDQLHVSQPIKQDLERLSQGYLSPKTEQFLTQLGGSARQKARKIRQYMHQNHWYPGGGDLQEAGALQHKLRTASDCTNYLQNLDNSEYLECYSANTLMIDLLRRSGIPARLVVGHHLDSGRGGKTQITQNTGHAWSEYWDDVRQKWVRLDGTPPAKPEDKKPDEKDQDHQEDQNSEDSRPVDEADDGGDDTTGQQGDSGEGGEGGESGQGGEGGSGSEGGQSGESGGQTGQSGGQSGQSGQPQMDQIGDTMSERMQQMQEQMDQADQMPEMAEANGDDLVEAERALHELQGERQRMQEMKEHMEQQISDAKDCFQDLEQMREEVQEHLELHDLDKQDLEDRIDALEEEKKRRMKEKLEQMEEDGFLDEHSKEVMEDRIENGDGWDLDRIQRQIDAESRMHNEYEHLREEVLPLVDQWFEYFAEKLPRQQDVSLDEDSLTRRGSFDRRAVQKFRNLLLSTVKNPRILTADIRPRFLATMLLDISGSMEGNRIAIARRMMIFYSELFSKISEVYGYIRFSMYAFSDSIRLLKAFDQDYDAVTRYSFGDGGPLQTVKVRLMKAVQPTGGTNTFPALQYAADDLNRECDAYPDYASAFYFMGDGEDETARQCRYFLSEDDPDRGFGPHMLSACVFGGSQEYQALAGIFGYENTTVTNSFEEMVEIQMTQFEDDIKQHLGDLGCDI